MWTHGRAAGSSFYQECDHTDPHRTSFCQHAIVTMPCVRRYMIKYVAGTHAVRLLSDVIDPETHAVRPYWLSSQERFMKP